MPKLVINGQEIEAAPGTTIIRAAKDAGIAIPYYCWHPALSVAGNCRMCLVDVEKAPKLMISCQTTVAEGMVVHTDNEKVRKARAGVQEFLFLNHPLDCPVCDQAGECKLQEYYVRFEKTPGRFQPDDKTAKPKAQDWGQMVKFDGERCINCTRCVRVMGEFAEKPVIGQINRGSRTYVATFNDEPLPHGYSGNVVDFCPVGALTLKDFRFQQRVWFLNNTDSVCPGCSRGCLTRVDHRDQKLFRMVPRAGTSGEFFMCDDGRMLYKEANEARLVTGAVGRASGSGAGERKAVSADVAAGEAARLLGPMVGGSASSERPIAFVVSAWLTCEDAWAAALFARDVLGVSRLWICGRAAGVEDAILMRGDKNPNRAGVEAIAKALGLEAVGTSGGTLARAIEGGQVKAVYWCAANVEAEVASIGEKALERAEVVIVQAANGARAEGAAVARDPKHQTIGGAVPPAPGAAPAFAHVTLPAASWAESNGTWLNFEGRPGTVRACHAPRAESAAHWRLLHAVAARMGHDLRCGALAEFAADVQRAIESVAKVPRDTAAKTVSPPEYGR